jgi:hypothetical protein
MGRVETDWGRAGWATWTIANKFNTGIYKSQSQKVVCDHSVRGAGCHSRFTWTVKICEMPGHVEEERLRCAVFNAKEKPRHVERGKPSYSFTHNEASEAVRKCLRASARSILSSSRIWTTRKGSKRWHDFRESLTQLRRQEG